MSSNASTGLGNQNQAIGEGSTGGNHQGGKDSQAGGREMGDSESSLKGDTSIQKRELTYLASVYSLLGRIRSSPKSSQPNVNNEYPSTGKEGANIKTDSESAKFSSEGSSEATFATK
ncbi:hypothetical protein JCM10450v2_001611 [Rhodotorula kratochvilovae]